MQTQRQTTDNADAEAAAASDELVRSLQSQLQDTVDQLVAIGRTDIVRAVFEQVVGASGSQAVEPGQPATGDLAYGSSHWDKLPAEIHAMILKHAGLLTRFLCGLLDHKDTLDEATRLQLWADAFKVDWQGDLALLPYVKLTVHNGLLLAHSRSMYDRLCKRFPLFSETEGWYARVDEEDNDYDYPFDTTRFDDRRLLLIAMRHGWFDLIDFTYPITLARLSIRFGCLDLLKHLDDKYRTLQDWMARHNGTSTYWHGAVDHAAGQGHLDVVQYLFDAGVTGCTTKAMDYAAFNGHLNVLKWLHENRTEGCSFLAMHVAAERGHLDVVKWLHEIRGLWCTYFALDNTIRSGHADVVKYLYSIGYRASINALVPAVHSGNVELLQYLMGCGYAVDLEALNRAKDANIADILLGSLTLDQAQALLAEAKQGYSIKTTTVNRLVSTITKLEASSKR